MKKKAYNFLEYAATASNVELQKYFNAIMVTARIGQPEKEFQIPQKYTKDIKFFFNSEFSSFNMNYKDFINAVKMPLEALGSEFIGPIPTYSEKDMTTNIKFIIRTKNRPDQILEWDVSEEKNMIFPKNEKTRGFYQ